MSKWRYKVEAAVHPVVHNVPSVQPAFIVKIALKLVVNVLDDGLETGCQTQDDIFILKLNNLITFRCLTAQTHSNSM